MANTVIIKCGNCEQKLRVPSDRGTLEVACPKCKSKFLYKPNQDSQTVKPAASNSFREELKKMSTPPKHNYYSDEQVYQMLLQEMYENCAKGSLRSQCGKSRSGIVQAKFQFSYYKEFNRGDDVSGYRKDSDVYHFVIDDYDGWNARLCFQPLYKMETTGGAISTRRKRFVLTPLGERVYNDLKRMAAADGVTVHEPVGYYSTDYNSFGSRKRYTCTPKINEYFYGKDPSHYTHDSCEYVEIPISITI